MVSTEKQTANQHNMNKSLDDCVLAYHHLASLRRKPGVIKKPDFIGVGAGRCGTTTIYEMLKTHPSIKFSPVKELNYFGIFDRRSNRNGLTFKEYQSYFASENVSLLRGEISPAYLSNETSLAQIKEVIPDVKIIVTLRNHFERFFSQYKHHQQQSGFEDFNSYCKEALLHYEDHSSSHGWFTPWKNLEQSLYFKGLKFINQNFPSTQIHLTLFNNLVVSPTDECNKICNFLNIEEFTFSDVCKNKSPKMDIPSIDFDVKKKLVDLFKKDLNSCIEIYPELATLDS